MPGDEDSFFDCCGNRLINMIFGGKNTVITIRRAIFEDIPGIMRFMDENWKPGNILAKDRGFFEWQFADRGKLNMFIGVDDTSGKIYGIIGAVVYNKSATPDVSGCTWQVIKSGNPMLGLDLHDFMLRQLNVRYCYGLGLSDKTVRINELSGVKVIAMDHYYRLADRHSYKIASVKRKRIPEVEESGYHLERIRFVEEMKQIIPEEELEKRLLSKDYSYIDKRYFKHPVFHYDIWKVAAPDNNSNSVLITRDEMAEGGKVCEIIDHYGDMEDLGRITAALDNLMKEREYEFVDVYSYGIPVEIYEKGGFCRCDEDSENIIPNYFHPFVKKNISLRVLDAQLKGLILFRGDGDQDRPC